MIAIINSENTELVEILKNRYKDKCVILSEDDDMSAYSLVVLTSFETKFKKPEGVEILAVHPSLLPAFKGENAIQQAFLSGVKVTGVTVHKVEDGEYYGKILAQYPVLIGLTTHINELHDEILAVTKRIYPAVIDSVINDRVFDFSDLFKSSCSHSCSSGSGCSGCSSKGCH
ncbi:MAG: formyltransferase family protein [Candidatus Gastranaerophilaceae bacterium]